MEQLLQKAKLNKSSLKRTVSRLAVGEISKMSEICYYPPLKAPYFKLLHEVGLTDSEVKSFMKRFWGKHPARAWKLHNQPPTLLLVFIMVYFLKNKDEEGFSLSVLYLLVRYFSNLMNSNIKYCNEDVFRYTLERLTKTHLFVREKTISNGILYLSKELARKWKKDIEKIDVDSIAKFITESRTRVSQSVKNFAKIYYRASEEGAGIKTQKEPETDEEMGLYQYRVLERGRRAVDEVVKKITVYKHVDKKAVDDARQLTRVQSTVAMMIATTLADLKYSENIKIIYQQFIKDLTDAKMLCGPGFISYIKKLMAVKRTTSTIYFKQQVAVLTEILMKSMRKGDWYRKLTPQTKFSVNSYLAIYLTMTFRNTLC